MLLPIVSIRNVLNKTIRANALDVGINSAFIKSVKFSFPGRKGTILYYFNVRKKKLKIGIFRKKQLKTGNFQEQTIDNRDYSGKKQLKTGSIRKKITDNREFSGRTKKWGFNKNGNP